MHRNTSEKVAIAIATWVRVLNSQRQGPAVLQFPSPVAKDPQPPFGAASTSKVPPKISICPLGRI